MKAYELYTYLCKDLDITNLDHLDQQQHWYNALYERHCITEDIDDPDLDYEVKNWTTGLIKNNFTKDNIVVELLVSFFANKPKMLISFYLLRNKNLGNIRPNIDISKYRNSGILVFKNKEFAKDFVAYLKIIFTNKYDIEIKDYT
ncbi:MAG: hypothetical protein HC836_16470 [Richelia sp. RM2_1_2]|nr:hypothetical protein [Richelia sp. RM2_1_2]